MLGKAEEEKRLSHTTLRHAERFAAATLRMYRFQNLVIRKQICLSLLFSSRECLLNENDITQ